MRATQRRMSDIDMRRVRTYTKYRCGTPALSCKHYCTSRLSRYGRLLHVRNATAAVYPRPFRCIYLRQQNSSVLSPRPDTWTLFTATFRQSSILANLQKARSPPRTHGTSRAPTITRRLARTRPSGANRTIAANALGANRPREGAGCFKMPRTACRAQRLVLLPTAENRSSSQSATL